MNLIRIRFPDEGTERKGLGYLAGRFSFKTFSTGETLVPDFALPSLALAGIPYQVIGPATYEHFAPTPVRDTSATAV